MIHVNRSILMGAVMAALVAFLVAGCSGVATKEIEAERTELHHKPLELNAKDHPDASIDSSGTVKIGSDTLALTDAQRAMTAHYRDAVIDLLDLTLDETSRLTRHAMAKALFGLATGRLEKTEQKIERQAEKVVHTPRFCGLLDEMRQRQVRMVQSVVKLKPYVHLSRQDVEDCAAGRPYQADFQAP